MLILIDIYQLRQHNYQHANQNYCWNKNVVDIIITKIDDTKTIRSGLMELGISDHNWLIFVEK
jgi:hypothetical protein